MNYLGIVLLYCMSDYPFKGYSLFPGSHTNVIFVIVIYIYIKTANDLRCLITRYMRVKYQNPDVGINIKS